MSNAWKCELCKKELPDYVPEYCCTYISIDTPCGCMAKPIEPPLCEACWAKVFNTQGRA